LTDEPPPLRSVREMLFDHGFPNALIVRHDRQNLKRMLKEAAAGEWFRPGKNVDYALNVHAKKKSGENVEYVVIFEATNSQNAVLKRVYRCTGEPEKKGSRFWFWEKALKEVDAAKLEKLANKLVIPQWTHRGYCLKNDKTDQEGFICSGHRALDSAPPPERLEDTFFEWRELKELFERSHVYPDWQEALRNHDGVYAIRDVNTGHLYVGTTYNKPGAKNNATEGIWDRWEGYANTTHNDNKLLMKHVEGNGTENLRICLLETWEIKETPHRAATEREGLWKEKLGSRKTTGLCGLNHN